MLLNFYFWECEMMLKRFFLLVVSFFLIAQNIAASDFTTNNFQQDVVVQALQSGDLQKLLSVADVQKMLHEIEQSDDENVINWMCSWTVALALFGYFYVDMCCNGPVWSRIVRGARKYAGISGSDSDDED